ncbi:hypothetical protein OA011_00335 [bacterium]|nr:hypothetical protein [bacterium]
MGKTIFTDSEILMFARTVMGGVTLSREKPEFDEAPFEGPWESASDGPDIPAASSEPPPAPISKDNSEIRRSTRASRPRLQFLASSMPRDQDERFRSPRHESRSKASQIAKHLKEVFTAGTNRERPNLLYESDANALLDEMGGDLYRYFLWRMEDERDLEWLDGNILELAITHRDEAIQMTTVGSNEEQVRKSLMQANMELENSSSLLANLSSRYREIQAQLDYLATSLTHPDSAAMSQKLLMSLQYSLEELAERHSEIDRISSSTLTNLADTFALLSAPKQFLQELGFTPNVTKNPYIMRRLQEHLDDLKMFDEKMDNAFGKES